MPLLSIITSAYAPRATFLAETIASIETLKLPGRWELEWIVQEDGAQPELADHFANVPVARYQANGAQRGIAATRNLALARASGSILQALDQDDILLPHSLQTLLPRFDDPAIHWAVGQADDLMPDGTRRPYPSAIPFGVLEAGYVNQWAADHDGNWPIHGAALTLRTAPWRALGGWTGIPYDDELATFAALSQIANGYHDQALTWLYRQHPDQTHRTTDAIETSAQGRLIALQRAAAVAEAGLRIEESNGFGDPAKQRLLGPPVKQRG
jgi:glycosyltransferase involved in cell wall biosynthesis